MSQLDVVAAKKALAARLLIWGIDEPASRAEGFIDDLVTQGWAMQPRHEIRPRPPKADEQCPRHPGQWADNCGPCLAPAAYDGAPQPVTVWKPGDAVAGAKACRQAITNSTTK